MSTWLEYWNNKAEIDKIEANNTIEKKLPLSDWEDYLGRLSHISFLGKRIRSTYSAIMWISAIFVIFSLIFSAYLLAAILAAVFVFAYIQRRKVHTFTVNHKIDTFVRPFLVYLRDEVWSESLLTLKIDLSQTQDPKKLNEKTKIYEHEWLVGNTRLMDGSVMYFKFIDYFKTWTVTKRGAVSGKTKTKRKYKTVTKYKIYFSWDKNRYPKAAELSNLSDKFKLKSKQKSKKVSPTFDPLSFAKAFQPVYQENLFKYVS